MIGRGKQADVYLYEITEQDLLLGDAGVATYQAGNVLLFADKRSVALGAELARADDLASAREYISKKTNGALIWEDHRSLVKEGSVDSTIAELLQRLEQKDDSLRGLTEKIEQRDELLKDVAESLKEQQQVNELLHLQIKQARDQMAVAEMVRSELVDDLQNVSKDTHTIESTLEHVLEEKFSLEQELAERITDLVELNLQNDDLRKQLSAPRPSNNTDPELVVPRFDVLAKASSAPSKYDTDWLSGLQQTGTEKTSEFPNQQILTMSSGKRIHVMHEFPEAKNPKVSTRLKAIALFIVRTLGVVLLVIIGLISVSVLATAQANDISYGDALDLIIERLRF